MEDMPLATLEQTECRPGYLSLAVLQMLFMPALLPESPMPWRKTTGTKDCFLLPWLTDLALVTSLPQLWYLDLSHNQIGLDGVESLACAEGFPELSHVVLDGNPGDVHERAGLEEAVVHVSMPPEGETLEATYGRVRWLHFPEACWKTFPPNPCGPPLA